MKHSSTLCLTVLLSASAFVASCSSKATTSVGGNSGHIPLDDCGPAADCGPSGGQFFDNGKVAELRIYIADDDVEKAVAIERLNGKLDSAKHGWLDVLWARFAPCDTVVDLPVTMEYRSPDHVGNAVLSHVGMRLRGTKSRGINALQGFKLDINELTQETDLDAGSPSRKFANLNTVNALSIEGDFSLMLQCAAYKVMRDNNVPAPRCNHLSVYINGAYYGLMQSVESVHTNSFLKKAFDDKTGSLYAASAGCLYKDSFADLKYISDSFSDYLEPPKYEQVQGATGAPDSDLVPMLKCGDATSTPDPEAFRACIQEWIDVPEWLRLIAGESLMPTLESFLGALRNYYLYFAPDVTAPHGGRFKIYSWDYDTAFQHQQVYPASGDPFSTVTQWFFPSTRAKLATRLTSVFKAEYCAAMNTFLSDVYKPELIDEIAAPLESVVSNAALTSSTWPLRSTIACGDDAGTDAGTCKGAPLTTDVWRSNVAEIRDFIAQNRTKMTALVATKCGTPSVDAGGQ